MINNFQLNLDSIKNISLEEKRIREKKLMLFNDVGFPSKKFEEWKFTDLNKIITDNFKELTVATNIKNNENINLINDFEHNFLIIKNGILEKINLKYEDEEKVKVDNYEYDLIDNDKSSNPLINLNNALFQSGYSLKVHQNYKLNRPLVIYNLFSGNLDNKIINNKNSIKLENNSQVELVELNFDNSSYKFIQNSYTNISIGKESSLINYSIQGNKSNGFFYKFVKSILSEKSNYEDYIFSSGLKFNKIEEEIDINGDEAKCNIQSAIFLELDEHNEIKTLVNHFKPNCNSYQKIKNVLSDKCKGAYQGKIFVRDIAQKTDAYQLSKALLLKDTSEFNTKPELEIYADDVKCSHGSTSGSVNEDSIYYLMTRGLNRKSAIALLTKAFLFEVINSISNIDIKKFIEKNLDRQIYGH